MRTRWLLLAVSGLVVCSGPAQAEDGFRKLGAPEIRRTVPGMEFTDEVHWAYVFQRGGRLGAGVARLRRRVRGGAAARVPHGPQDRLRPAAALGLPPRAAAGGAAWPPSLEGRTQGAPQALRAVGRLHGRGAAVVLKAHLSRSVVAGIWCRSALTMSAASSKPIRA